MMICEYISWFLHERWFLVNRLITRPRKRRFLTCGVLLVMSVYLFMYIYIYIYMFANGLRISLSLSLSLSLSVYIYIYICI